MSIKPFYEENDITIYHADCIEFLNEENFIKPDLILTDPPYNAKNIGPNQRTYENQQMQLSFEEYKLFCENWFSAVHSYSSRIVFTPGISNTHFYLQPKWQLCWHKPASVSFNRMGGFNAWEPVFVYGDTKHVRLGQDYLLFNTLNFSKDHEKDHPCPKPRSLWDFLVSKFSIENEVILDPFMGSGTTLVSAKNLGRKAIGIEKEEKYCEIAVNRLKQEVINFK